MRLLNQAPPVAIDFGVGSLKVLQIAPGPPLALVTAACLETPDELLENHAARLDFQAEALPRLIRSCGLTIKRAVCAIPSGMAFCKHLRFGSADAGALPAMVRSAVSVQVGCEQDALVYRHAPIAPGATSCSTGRTELICMAVPRELVARLMGTIKASRLEPVGMHSEHHAALRSLDAIAASEEEAPGPTATLVLDVGAGTTKVAIAHGPELAFCKTIELGGRHVDQAVAAQARCDLRDARAERLAMGELTVAGARETVASGAIALLPASRPSAPVYDVSEPLSTLTDEVALCLRYHRTLYPEKAVGRVVFVGGEARHTGLCRHIARTLRLPAQVADPMAGIARTGSETCVGVDFKLTQPGWAMALGLCLCPTDL